MVGWEWVGMGGGRARRGMGKGYLGAAGGVLGGAAGDEFGVAVLEQVFVEGHVFFFGEDGVVGFEAVVREHGFVAGIDGLAWWDGRGKRVSEVVLALVLGYLVGVC